MEIENPNPAEFVPLPGAFNFEYIPMGGQNLPDNLSFRIDWTKKGDGQEILQEGIRSGSPIRVKQHGQLYRGVFARDRLPSAATWRSEANVLRDCYR
jgi:hypothetical protein